MTALVPVSALLVAGAFAAGLFPGKAWLTQLLTVLAVGQGVVAGLALPRFWRGPASREIFGAGGWYLGFVAAVVFSAVEAHAVGRAVTGGAPRAAWILLMPPLVLAAFALRGARARAGGEGEERSATMESERRRSD